VNAKILAIWFAIRRATTVIIRLVRNRALERMIQYAVTVIITLEGRGVPDAPPWA